MPTNDDEVNEAIGENYEEQTDKTEEDIDQEFSELIRDKLTDEEFWKWVAAWKDANMICEEAEDWSSDLKEEEIANIKEMLKCQKTP